MSNILLERYCASMAKQNTLMRKAIPAAKRLTIFLDWANSGSPHQHLARTYEDSKAAVCIIIHDAVFILCKEFVLSMIAFPEGDDLLRVIHEISNLCSLPCCAGAVNGTCMKIEKPCKWGDAYFCCKKHMAVILFVCVGAREPQPSTGHRCLYALGATCLLLLVSSLLAFWLGRSLGGAPLRAPGKHHAPP